MLHQHIHMCIIFYKFIRKHIRTCTLSQTRMRPPTHSLFCQEKVNRFLDPLLTFWGRASFIHLQTQVVNAKKIYIYFQPYVLYQRREEINLAQCMWIFFLIF